MLRDVVTSKLPEWVRDNTLHFQKNFCACIIKEKHEALKTEMEIIGERPFLNRLIGSLQKEEPVSPFKLLLLWGHLKHHYVWHCRKKIFFLVICSKT